MKGIGCLKCCGLEDFDCRVGVVEASRFKVLGGLGFRVGGAVGVRVGGGSILAMSLLRVQGFRFTSWFLGHRVAKNRVFLAKLPP